MRIIDGLSGITVDPDCVAMVNAQNAQREQLCRDWYEAAKYDPEAATSRPSECTAAGTLAPHSRQTVAGECGAGPPAPSPPQPDPPPPQPQPPPPSGQDNTALWLVGAGALLLAVAYGRR